MSTVLDLEIPLKGDIGDMFGYVGYINIGFMVYG